MTKNNKYKLIIIGSGPAGLSAAIYAGRAELQPLVLAGATPGGQLMLTTQVENFPGFIDGIMGPELMHNMIEQAKRFGSKFVNEDVTGVDFSSQPYKLTAGGSDYFADAVIIATGSHARWLGLPAEEKFRGKGIHTCATCDGFFYKGKTIAVVGGGDAAMEESTFLTKFAEKVYVLVRKDSLRASKIMQERAQKNSKVDFMFNTEIVDLIGEKNLEKLILKDGVTGQQKELVVDGVFLAIGHDPSTKFLQGSGVDLDERGYVKPVERTKTSISGVFVAGDVDDYVYKQAISAAGEGCRAALDAERFLASQES